MCLNPTAWYIRSTEGYSISKDKNRKVTHNLFVDDLKTYHKSQSKATLITNTVKGMFEDIGLSWGLQKCAAVHIKKGKIMPSSELPLTSGDNILVLGEDDYYKFLVKFENSVQLEGKVLELASEEFVRRLHIIWSSPLTVPRKVKATNCFAIPVLQYHMWSSDWPISSLQELDRNARKIICKFKGKHYHESNPLLYLPPERGGRGFQEITQLYETTKIKTAHHVTTSKDPRLDIVRQFQDHKESKNFRSVLKDAKIYARDMNLEIEFSSDDKTTVIKSDQRTVEIKDNQVKYLKPILKEARIAIYEKMTLDQPWLGQSTTLHWNDPMLSDGTYYILREWKNIPDTVISIYVNISQQLLPTKIYKANKLKETQHDLKCRLCGINNKTVPHLMCSCSEIAQSLYKSRHDKMLRPVYHQVLHKYSFESEVSKPWYQQEMPKPAKENKRAKVFWDIPIYVDKAPENGANRPDMVMLDKINKNWIIIEGTVCLIGEITEREKLKSSKYKDLREALKRLYPGYTVQQLNIVLDYLGGYNRSLIEEMGRLFDMTQTEATRLLRKSQKWVHCQNCEIVKKFYTHDTC